MELQFVFYAGISLFFIHTYQVIFQKQTKASNIIIKGHS